MKEYHWIFERPAVISLPDDMDAEAFLLQLLTLITEYVSEHNGTFISQTSLREAVYDDEE